MTLEFDMRIPVARWLLSRGLSPVCEVASLGCCDLVGVRFTERPVSLVEMVAVELKLRNVAAVLRQCQSHLAQSVTEVWAAMLPEVAGKHRDRFGDIGLLSVDSAGTVQVVKQAKRNNGCDLSPWKNAMRRRRHEYVWRMRNTKMRRFASPAASGGGQTR